MAAKLSAATIPAQAGDSKWSPTPTAGRADFSRLSGPVTGKRLFRGKRGRFEQSRAAIGRHRALLVQGLFADGVVFSSADSGRAFWDWPRLQDE